MIEKVLLALIVAAVASLAGGCSLLPQSVKDKGVDVAVQACTRMSATERSLLRDEINVQLAPKNITWCGLRCPNEPPPGVPGCQ